MNKPMFTVTGLVLKTFAPSPEVDKETGEQQESKPKVQILGEMPVKGGDTRNEIVTLTIESRPQYEALKGKFISVAIGIFAPSKGNVVYFIPKGSKPEVLSA